ncbi:hypothetical protein M9Y10_026719 [Tritrichomonas musculus]|uniref:Uncharacterized protein n=1 Tax=Tritrichomonas musculus TaxID=1915356 RepID=A0ABR2H6E5_9EUKA
MKKIWSFICRCISGYLIKKSYLKLKERSTKNYEPTIISEDEYVELREVGKGSVSSCVLISIIEQLFNRCCDTRPEKRPFICSKSKFSRSAICARLHL